VFRLITLFFNEENTCSIGLVSGLYGTLYIIFDVCVPIYCLNILEWCIRALSIKYVLLLLSMDLIKSVNVCPLNAFSLISYPITFSLDIAINNDTPFLILEYVFLYNFFPL